MRISVLLFCIIGLAFIACRSQEKEEALAVYALELEDSVRVDYFGELLIMDYTFKQLGIRKLFPLNKKLLVIYNKGISPDIIAEHNLGDQLEREELDRKYPLQFAIFDQDHKIQSVDMEMPKDFLYYSAVINKDNHLVALKNQEYFNVEEDFHTVYKYRLVEK